LFALLYKDFLLPPLGQPLSPSRDQRMRPFPNQNPPGQKDASGASPPSPL
jgi:hypothetical protein